MGIELTDIGFNALIAPAHHKGELIYQLSDLGIQINLPKQLGEERRFHY